MAKTKQQSIKVKMTADDISQAIGEWLYNQDKLPKGMEEGIVNFKVEEGEFVIEVYNPTVASASIN
jgi:alpha-galactosidase